MSRPRTIAPASGAQRCSIVGCVVYTKSPSGICAKCAMSRGGRTKCTLCSGAPLDGVLNYCTKHQEIFSPENELIFRYDVSARLASILINSDSTNGIVRLSQSAIHKRLLDGARFLIEDHEDPALKQAYDDLFQRLYRQIAAFDRDLEKIFTAVSIARLVSIKNEQDSDTTGGSDSETAEASDSRRGTGGDTGSGPSQPEPPAPQANIPTDAERTIRIGEEQPVQVASDKEVC